MKNDLSSKSFGLLFVGAIVLATSACSAKLEGSNLDPFGQINIPGGGDGGACPAGYAPIAMESAGTPSNFDEAISAGDLNYISSETYFQITKADAVIAQAHVVDAPNADIAWKCSNSTPQASDYSVDTNLNLPVTIARVGGQNDAVVHGYQISMSNGSGAGLMTDRQDNHVPASLPQLLSLQNVSNYRIYRLADGTFEVRLQRSESVGSDGVAATTSVTHYSVAPRSGSAQ